MNHRPSEEPPQYDTVDWNRISSWLGLITAVLAIPSLGFVIVNVAGIEGGMGVVVFMICCWAATYLGMHIASHPNMHKFKDFTRDE